MALWQLEHLDLGSQYLSLVGMLPKHASYEVYLGSFIEHFGSN